jgi:type II secretory pathway pseudopilin PulG
MNKLRHNGYFLLEVVVAMGILTLVVTSLMSSLQSSQANIQEIRFKQIALQQCESALEEIQRAWQLDPSESNPHITRDGSFVEMSDAHFIPCATSSTGLPMVGYRAHLQQSGGVPGEWHPVGAWTPAGSAPIRKDGLSTEGLLFVEVRAYSVSGNPDISTIATLTALLAVEF